MGQSGRIYRNKQTRILSLLILLTGFIWWSGIAGSALYGVPSLIVMIYCFYLIKTGAFPNTVESMLRSFCDWCISQNGKKWILGLFILQAILWQVFVLFKYYSFNLFTLDVAYYSNIIYNTAQGDLFTSYFNMNSLGEHFTLSISFISLFYKIVPSTNWMMGFKILAYVCSPILIYRICNETLADKKKVLIYAFLLTCWWFFFYRPIVNSVRYEFQSSCLSPPIIMFAFLSLRKKHWIRFFLAMIFLLGIKEHMGSVWIGFGCYLVLKNPRKILGYALIICGIAAIYFIMFQIKPYLRGAVDAYNDVNLVDPFADLHLKAIYFFSLLVPLVFIPLIYWKNGIMAGPAIGVNLISGYQTMYTSHYHYDDVPSTMLFIALILSLSSLKPAMIMQQIRSRKSLQIALVLWLFIFLYRLPYSVPRFIKNVIPNAMHQETIAEIEKFRAGVKGVQIATQDVLGPHFYRREIQVFYPGKNCADGNDFSEGRHVQLPDFEYLVLAPKLSQFGIPNMEQCLVDMDQSKTFGRVEGYQHLVIYRKTDLVR